MSIARVVAELKTQAAHYRAQADSDESNGAHIGITAYNRGLAAGYAAAAEQLLTEARRSAGEEQA